jgi:ribosomal protein L37AE/L43A
MRYFVSPREQTARSASSTPEADVPASCPTCRSASITTTAKNPDATSYWRCTKCGEIWNGSRRDGGRMGGGRMGGASWR